MGSPSPAGWGETKGNQALRIAVYSGRFRPYQRGPKETYGRSSKKPTVGRIDDLPWVVEAMHRRVLPQPFERHQRQPVFSSI